MAYSFILTLIVVTAFMQLCRMWSMGFVGIWNGIVVFFVTRALQSGIRAVFCHLLAPTESATPETERLLDLGVGIEDEEISAGRRVGVYTSVDEEPELQAQ